MSVNLVAHKYPKRSHYTCTRIDNVPFYKCIVVLETDKMPHQQLIRFRKGKLRRFPHLGINLLCVACMCLRIKLCRCIRYIVFGSNDLDKTMRHFNSALLCHPAVVQTPNLCVEERKIRTSFGFILYKYFLAWHG